MSATFSQHAEAPQALHLIAGLSNTSNQPTDYTNGKWFRLVRMGLNSGAYAVVERSISGKHTTHQDEGALLRIAHNIEADARLAKKLGNQHLLRIAQNRARELEAVVAELKRIFPEFA